jgi:hypothetical protein
VPSESPVIVQEVVVVVQVAPLLAVAVYPVIGDPPLDAGVAQLTSDSFVPPALAVTEVGEVGLSAVPPDADEDASDVPRAFVAVTVNV